MKGLTDSQWCKIHDVLLEVFDEPKSPTWYKDDQPKSRQTMKMLEAFIQAAFVA